MQGNPTSFQVGILILKLRGSYRKLKISLGQIIWRIFQYSQHVFSLGTT